MKRILKQAENRPRKRVFKMVWVFTMVILLVIFAEVLVVNRLSTFGSKIQQIKDSQANLRLENQVLENEIAKHSSLLSVESSSSKLGFESVKNLEYIKLTTNIASVL